MNPPGPGCPAAVAAANQQLSAAAKTTAAVDSAHSSPIFQSDDSLICNEVFEMQEDLNKTPDMILNPSHHHHSPSMAAMFSVESLPPTVSAVSDPGQLNDSRVLQNLLRNEHRFLPTVPDYMSTVQQ